MRIHHLKFHALISVGTGYSFQMSNVMTVTQLTEMAVLMTVILRTVLRVRQTLIY